MRALLLGITVVFLTSCYEELQKTDKQIDYSYTEYIGHIDLSNSQKIIIDQYLKPTQYVITLSNNQLDIKTTSGTRTVNINQQMDWIKDSLQNTRICRYHDKTNYGAICAYLPEAGIRILDYNYDSKYYSISLSGYCTYEGFCSNQDLELVQSVTTYLDSIRDQISP